MGYIFSYPMYSIIAYVCDGKSAEILCGLRVMLYDYVIELYYVIKVSYIFNTLIISCVHHQRSLAIISTEEKSSLKKSSYTTTFPFQFNKFMEMAA